MDYTSFISAMPTTELAWHRLGNYSEWPGSAVRFRAKQMLGKHGFAAADLDDLCQELALHVYSRWSVFDPQRSSPKTFLDRLLCSKQAELRRRARTQLLVRPKVLRCGGAETFPQPDAAADSDLRIDLAAARSELSDYQYQVATLLMKHSPSEVSRQLGIHRARIYEIIHRIRKRFEDAGLAIYAK